MYEIAIINPRPKKRRKSTGKKGASKMAKRRKARKSRPVKKAAAPRRRRVARAAAPRKRRRAGKRSPAVGYVVGAKRIRRRKLNPRRVSRSRRRSNPRFNLGGITNQIMPALYGAGGGLALDVALGYLPLPDMLKTGYARHGVRIVGALGIGWLASKFLRGKGKDVAAGALTVAIYGLLKDVAVQVTAGKVKGLGDYEEVEVAGYYDPAPQIGAYMSDAPGVGAYMSGDHDGSYDNMGAMDY